MLCLDCSVDATRTCDAKEEVGILYEKQKKVTMDINARKDQAQTGKKQKSEQDLWLS